MNIQSSNKKQKELDRMENKKIKEQIWKNIFTVLRKISIPLTVSQT